MQCSGTNPFLIEAVREIDTYMEKLHVQKKIFISFLHTTSNKTDGDADLVIPIHDNIHITALSEYIVCRNLIRRRYS